MSKTYDELVGTWAYIFLRYRRIIFPKKKYGFNDVLDYECAEYLNLRDWVNNEAPSRAVAKISFGEDAEKHPFKITGNGKLEANERSEDYDTWVYFTEVEPYADPGHSRM